MSDVYARARWVVNNDEGQSLEKLVRLASSLECELWPCDIEDDHFDAVGFMEFRCAIRAPSSDIYDAFVREAQRLPGFERWETVNREYFDRVTHWFGDVSRGKKPTKLDLDELKSEVFWHRIKGLAKRGEHNRILKKLLHNSTPLYFVCKWTVPANVEIHPQAIPGHVPWVGLALIPHFIIADAIQAAEHLGADASPTLLGVSVGRHLRAGASGIDADGSAYQTLHIRVFDIDEMRKFKEAIEHLNLGEWVEETEAEFLTSYILYQYSFMTFYQNVLRLAEHNRKRKG